TDALHAGARARHINLREIDCQHLGLSLDETTSQSAVDTLWEIFVSDGQSLPDFAALAASVQSRLPAALLRQTAILSHPVFN
ncbi:hypothetical protein RA279_29080, partial [Pseudomonas syringae pv. tagetis]|uniref:hypothetical protein n=1 Tax=Pseudomonas syringae group genomosp. 7 TaxID=251699 RepID=UPI00376F6649